MAVKVRRMMARLAGIGPHELFTTVYVFNRLSTVAGTMTCRSTVSPLRLVAPG
jgi:hypothetical protein